MRGPADLGFWRERLRDEHLEPASHNGRAELHIGATAARFLGIEFREFIICVLLEQPGVFLVQAFNSIGAFAWFERTLFQTPYRAARIALDLHPAPVVDLSLPSGRLLHAAMSAESASAMQAASAGSDVVWEVPVYLPRRPASRNPGKVFYARIAGVTHSVPFDAGRDAWEILPAAEDPALRMLLDSAFAPREWIVRPDATHAKSKTVRRPTPTG